VQDIKFSGPSPETYGYGKLSAWSTVKTAPYWKTVHFAAHEVDVDCDQSFEVAFDDLAKKIMEDLTPHERVYYEYVKVSNKNPAAKNAALSMQAGNWKQAAKYAMEAIKNAPQDPNSYYIYGLVKRHEMKYAISTAYFEKAYSMKPDTDYKYAISKNRQLQTNDAYVRKQLTGE